MMNSVGLFAFAIWALSALAFPLNGDWARLETRAAVITTAELDLYKFYAQYAAAAYCNGEADAGSLINCTEGACPDVTASKAIVVTSFGGAVTDVQGFVATDPTHQLVVVSFMGSVSIRQWIANLIFFRVGVDDIVTGGSVHAGFLSAFQEAKEDLMAGVAAAVKANPSYPIIVTGHSLGGALGTIAAAYLRTQGYACDLWTYGSPRVGNSVFADFVTAQAGAEYRATTQDDPVPRLPPIWTGYRHTSPEYWFDHDISAGATYSVNDVKLCTGNANIDCNAGQSGFNITAHTNYFGHISGCGVDGIVWRETDAELEAKVTAWALKDIAYVEAGNATTST